MKTPIVALIGRPNVGKSTIFNKIIGSKVAITAKEAGTTRDRLFRKVQNAVLDFFLVDTGGLEFGKGENNIEDDMQTQSRIAIDEADLILFVVDGQTELSAQDYAAAELLRKKNNEKPIILLANKCDHPLSEIEISPFYALGLGEPHQLSAFHKTGFSSLSARILDTLKSRHFLPKSDPIYQARLREEANHPNVAMVGKPNVGKSSLINAILRKDKLIVSPIAGTTRDSTDTLVRYQDKTYNFIDTAGLKRPGKTEMGIEKFSALRSMSSIERSDIALLVLDSSEKISHQDQQISHYIVEMGKGLVILVNKWDLGKTEEDESKRRAKYIAQLKYRFPFLAWAPVVFTSAVTRKNLHPIFGQIEIVMEERRKRIPTAKLNQWVEKTIIQHPPTGAGALRPKIYYLTQTEVNPPRFTLFVNKKAAFHFSYLRYLENRLRESFGFVGTAIKLEYREKVRDESRAIPPRSSSSRSKRRV